MPSPIQHASNSGSGIHHLTVTLPSVVAGHTIAVFAAMKDFSHSLTFSLSDGANSYVSRATKVMNSGAGLAQWWDVESAAAGSPTIAVDVSGATDVDMLVLIAWELPSSTFDQVATVANGGTSWDAGNLTPATASGTALMGAAVIQEGAVPTFTPGSGFALDESQQVSYSAAGGAGGESQSYSSTSAIDGSISCDNAGSEGAAIFATYSAGGGGGGSAQPVVCVMQ
jgi:hypothetical protein